MTVWQTVARVAIHSSAILGIWVEMWNALDSHLVLAAYLTLSLYEVDLGLYHFSEFGSPIIHSVHHCVVRLAVTSSSRFTQLHNCWDLPKSQSHSAKISEQT